MPFLFLISSCSSFQTHCSGSNVNEGRQVGQEEGTNKVCGILSNIPLAYLTIDSSLLSCEVLAIMPTSFKVVQEKANRRICDDNSCKPHYNSEVDMNTRGCFQSPFLTKDDRNSVRISSCTKYCSIVIVIIIIVVVVVIQVMGSVINRLQYFE